MEEYTVQGGSEMLSLWLTPILYGFEIVSDLPSPPPYEYNVLSTAYIWALLVFLAACVLSIIIEFFFIRVVNSSEHNERGSKHSFLNMVISANFASYILIVCCLFSIGFFAGISGVVDPITELSWLFFSTSGDSTFLLLFAGIVLIVILFTISLKADILPIPGMRSTD